MRTSPVLALLALVACPAPETGYDNSHIVGSVVVPARMEDEGGRNDKAADANDLGTFDLGYTVIDGSISAWDLSPDGVAGTGDADWQAFEVDSAYEGVAYLYLGEAAAQAGPPALPDTGGDSDTDSDPPDTSVPDDTATDTAVVIPAGPLVEIAIADISDAKQPVFLASETFDANGGELTYAFEPGVRYGVRVKGVVGEGELTYRLALPEAHPDGAGILVGGFASNDPVALGAPISGTTPGPFRLEADWSYTADYEALFAKSVTTEEIDTDGTEQSTVDEDIPEIWMFAATWPNLNAGLRAGTFYSSAPQHVDLAAGDQFQVDPLVLDAFAEAQEGFSLTEEEPNEVNLDADPVDFSGAQDLGILSPAGFLDIVTGSIIYDPLDDDVYRFQVPASQTLYCQLGWGDASDVDLYILDGDVNMVDGAASYDNPEVCGGGALLDPGVDYYVLVRAYDGDPTITSTYTLSLEWGSP